METEKIILEKKGHMFEFTEGLFNGKPDMNVNLNGDSSSVQYMNDEKIVFQSSIGKIGGISSDGVDKEKYQKVKELYENIKKKKEDIEKKEEDENYAPLYRDMEKIPLPKKNENPDDEKCQEILKKKKGYYSDDPEDEGLNLAVSSQNSEIEREAQKYCDHYFKIEFFRSYTQDARKKLSRNVSCEKCGFFKRDVVEEKTDVGWI